MFFKEIHSKKLAGLVPEIEKPISDSAIQRVTAGSCDGGSCNCGYTSNNACNGREDHVVDEQPRSFKI